MFQVAQILITIMAFVLAAMYYRRWLQHRIVACSLVCQLANQAAHVVNLPSSTNFHGIQLSVTPTSVYDNRASHPHYGLWPALQTQPPAIDAT
jgi:hypothetical protein